MSALALGLALSASAVSSVAAYDSDWFKANMGAGLNYGQYFEANRTSSTIAAIPASHFVAI
jgi:hypothetical protein